MVQYFHNFFSWHQFAKCVTTLKSCHQSRLDSVLVSFNVPFHFLVIIFGIDAPYTLSQKINSPFFLYLCEDGTKVKSCTCSVWSEHHNFFFFFIHWAINLSMSYAYLLCLGLLHPQSCLLLSHQYAINSLGSSSGSGAFH